jgi:hypothetical protein
MRRKEALGTKASLLENLNTIEKQFRTKEEKRAASTPRIEKPKCFASFHSVLG